MMSIIIKDYIFNEIGAPKVIACDAQLEEYISALLELDGRSELTDAERNFAELLILLVEAYVGRRDFIRSGSAVEDLKELLSANDLSQDN